jgi:large subunit ribosomal protein L10
MAIPLPKNLKVPEQLVAAIWCALMCGYRQHKRVLFKELTLSLNRSEKEAVISEVTGLATKAQTLVIAEYRGITVADMTKLRTIARSNGVSLSVLKNTLARRAVAGSGFEVVSDQMTGPLIYGFSEDAVAAARVVADFAKTNDKLVIRAGAYGGKALDVNGVKQLASIPSKEVLLAQLLGLMQSPISRIARVMAALAEQKGGGAEAPAEAVAA